MYTHGYSPAQSTQLHLFLYMCILKNRYTIHTPVGKGKRELYSFFYTFNIKNFNSFISQTATVLMKPWARPKIKPPKKKNK